MQVTTNIFDRSGEEQTVTVTVTPRSLELCGYEFTSHSFEMYDSEFILSEFIPDYGWSDEARERFAEDVGHYPYSWGYVELTSPDWPICEDCYNEASDTLATFEITDLTTLENQVKLAVKWIANHV